MNIIAIVANFKFQDLLDILFLTIVAYHLFIWFQGTKAFKALIGLLVLGAVFTIAKAGGLFLTTWVFQFLWQILVILLVVLFQSEIRQVLEKVNPLQKLGFRKHNESEEWLAEFSKGVFALAATKTGALIIIERDERVQEYMTEGQKLEAAPTPEVLKSIFQKESPLHDGAILIHQGEITKVACYLPLTPAEGLPKEWGTRHRAAIGLSERCDAWIVVVSEERGEVSIARTGQMIHVEHSQALYQLIRESLAASSPLDKTWKERTRYLLLNRWRIKLMTLCLVSFLWLVLAGQQDFEVQLKVPIRVKGLPSQMEIVEPLNASIQVTLRGLRRDASILDKEEVMAEVDLSRARPGKMDIAITRNEIRLSDDRVRLVNVDPSRLVFVFKKIQEPK
ncbi:MAG: diadenylate cyclase CdaA [Deltaproteobacteria bacterium]|nr:diadenylate cyclase CdaA [Deltaproteobacteria bacterium]